MPGRTQLDNPTFTQGLSCVNVAYSLLTDGIEMIEQDGFKSVIAEECPRGA